MKIKSTHQSPASQRPSDAIYAAIENAAQLADKGDEVKPSIVAGCINDGPVPPQMKKSL